MRKIAPQITRQRLLIEGYYGIDVGKETIADYFKSVCAVLGLRMYGEPIIFSPGGLGKQENQGYDAFVPLVDSGISLYVWTNEKFISLILYTCKSFDSGKAADFTRTFFGMKELEKLEF